jgi:hypothetical protein
MRSILIFSVFLALLSGCNNSNLAENTNVSGCGGFKDEVSVLGFKNEVEQEPKCEQQIIWKFDEQTEVFSIINKNIPLNCCGEHDIIIKEKTEGYDFIMTDAPVRGARCGCMCVFDYAADIKNISGNSINLSIYIDTEENKGKDLFWEGTIDLAEKSGIIIVSELSSYLCEENYE